MKVLVTGAAGFIGSALSLRLLRDGFTVVGLDNHNDYYAPALKEARLARHLHHKNYTHVRLDLANREGIANLFAVHRPECVVNLAAQAGVRYSIENPMAYIDSNIVGFANILEGCRHNNVAHLVYASSSSVYGANTAMPFSVHHNVDHPLSFYAATKKANELMAHAYSHLYGLPTTGLRFFTVYGPWDRPDMALQRFASAIKRGDTLKIFNHGNHKRDFTFIDDIVEGLVRIVSKPAAPSTSWTGENPDPGTSKAPWRIYNIGNSKPVNLIEYIEALEKAFNKVARKEFLPLQPGDVQDTWADVDDLAESFNYRPDTTIESGIARFVDWFNDYYGDLID